MRKYDVISDNNTIRKRQILGGWADYITVSYILIAVKNALCLQKMLYTQSDLFGVSLHLMKHFINTK